MKIINLLRSTPSLTPAAFEAVVLQDASLLDEVRARMRAADDLVHAFEDEPRDSLRARRRATVWSEDASGWRDADVRVTIEEGLRGRLGDLTTSEPIEFSFSTFPPFEVDEAKFV